MTDAGRWIGISGMDAGKGGFLIELVFSDRY